MQELKRRSMDEYIDLTSDFEKKKRMVSPENEKYLVIRLPMSFLQIVNEICGCSMEEAILRSEFKNSLEFKHKQNKLRVKKDVAVTLFDRPVNDIIGTVMGLLKERALKGCKAILMVGGFSESPVLQNAIRRNFQDLKVIIPQEAGLAVLKGAAMFGFCPAIVTERVCKYTYGVETCHIYERKCDHPKCRQKVEDGKTICVDLFSMHARAGQAVKLREEQPAETYEPLSDDHTVVAVNIFRSMDVTPKFTTDPSCEKIGTLDVQLPDKSVGKDRSINVSFLFGGTEISVKATVLSTGCGFETRVNFLG